ncbi:ECF RNA polymerase sigma factor RpoE [termite gut metagenome]|uniref:ECF RNA polymerase sigma factor RpoE n=1 Tax=termite gut metagenome TaxID=433724 RepID=A0A5J4R611_9ZZZZ
MYENTELERKLIIDLIHDDESAFCELYATYKNRLIYFAMKFIKSQSFAEDVFQDAFLSVWKNRRFLHPDTPFAPYVYTIVKNRILNILADMNKEKELKKIILAKTIDFDNDTEDAVLDADFNNLLEKAISSLTPQQRRVFEMSRKEMKTHLEIANELHISVNTVQQHISASLKVIRSYLERYAGIYTDIVLLLLCFNP